MQPVPDDILSQFDALLDNGSVPVSLHDDYRKWLKYYLDFRVKYPPSDIKSEQVRLFIEKMRSKGKAGKDSVSCRAGIVALARCNPARSWLRLMPIAYDRKSPPVS